MMNSILVPVDFSQASKDAFHYAVRIGDMFHSRITLLHVLSAPVMNEKGFSEVETPEFRDPLEIEMAMREYEAEIPPGIASRIEIVHRIAMGEPIKEISHFIEQYSISLLVMGMKATENKKHFLMGSIVTKALQNTALPIIVIPEGAQFSRISEIVYAADFQDDEFKAIDTLLDFSFLYDARIHCIHINGRSLTKSAIKENEILFKKKYLEDVIFHALDCMTEENEGIVTEILKYCTENEVGMLAMLSLNRNAWSKFFYQTHSRKLALEAAIPLLIFDTYT